MSIFILDDDARERWSQHIRGLMLAAELPSQAELARRLAPRLALKEKTLKPYLTQLIKGDAAQLKSWFESPERLEALADELATNPFDLRAALESAPQSAPRDPWSALFSGSPPPPIEPRLRGRDGRWAWVVFPLRDWARLASERHRLPEALHVVGAAGREAERVVERLTEALTPEGAVKTVERQEAPSAWAAGALRLEVLPWGDPELAQLAERPRLPSAAREAVNQLRARLPRLGAALDPLLRPRHLLPWLVAVSRAEDEAAPSLVEHALDAVSSEVIRRSGSEGLRALGRPFLSALMAAWSRSLQPHERWGPVDREVAQGYIREALEQIEQPPLSEPELRQRLQSARAQGGVKPMRAALNELERLLLHDPLLLLDGLLRGGLLVERGRDLVPADPMAADLLAARGLVGRALPEALLHPHQGRLIRLLVAMGQDPEAILEAARRAPPAREAEAYQAAAFALGAAPERCSDPATHTIWAGAVHAAISGAGRATPFGRIQLEPFELDRALVLALRRLSDDARERLPELGAEAPLERLEALTPPSLLRFAELWGAGLPDLAFEAKLALPATAPFQVHPSVADALPEGEGGLIPLLAWTWRAEGGDARVQRLLGDYEGEAWALHHALERQSPETREALKMRWVAEAPANEEELEKRAGWLWRKASADLVGVQGQALLALLRRLPRPTVQTWIHNALLGPLNGFGLEAFSDPLTALVSHGSEAHTRLHDVDSKASARPLIQLAEALGDAELLTEIAGWGERLLSTPSLWTSALRWPRGSSLKLKESASATLEAFWRVDTFSEWAAVAAHRLGAPAALRRRWELQGVLPEDLVDHANALLLLSLATKASEAAWAKELPPGDAPAAPEPEPDGDGRWTLTVREGPGERNVVVQSASALPTARALCALAERLCEGPVRLSDEVLNWLLAVHDVQRGVEGLVFKRAGAARTEARWLHEWRWAFRPTGPFGVREAPPHPRSLAEWFHERSTRAGVALLELEDDALLQAAMSDLSGLPRDPLQRLLSPSFTRPVGPAVSACQDRLRAGGPLAERAWSLADASEQLALLRHLLEKREERLPVHWAHRAMASGDPDLVWASLPKLTPEDALEVGLPWIEQAGVGWARLERALQVHACAPWPRGITEELRRWALKEPDPYAQHATQHGRVGVAVNATRLLLDCVSEGPLEREALRGAATRLWPLALSMRRSRDEHIDHFYPSLGPRSQCLHKLSQLFIALEHGGPLIETWRALDASEQEPALREHLEEVVLPLLERDELRALRGRRSSEALRGVVRELLHRGDSELLEECEALLQERERWDVITETSLHEEHIPIHWVTALGELLRVDPDALERVFEAWLARPGAQHAELLRVLAALTAHVGDFPPALRRHARALLDRELERLLSR